jgi:GR25 family glycosyltransferase involved in LPS biosynthesis
MTFPRTFIIHLTRAVKREPQVAHLAAQIGPSAEVLPAVDGAQLSQADCDRALGPPIRPKYPFGLRKAEVATFLSHRACWHRIVAEGLDAALILEDDAALGGEFADALAFARRHLPEGAFVRFPIQDRESVAVVLAEEGGRRLFRPRTVGLRMCAQLVSRAAAKRLLAATETFDRPVDTFVQTRWAHTTDVLSVWPSGVSEVSDLLGGSLISEKKSLAERLAREVRRPIYRVKVAACSCWTGR